MKPLFRHLAVAGLLTLASGTSRALDLTPVPGFREMEGVKIPMLVFESGEKGARWQAPAGWRPSGGKDSLVLYPPDKSNTTMQLRIIPLQDALAPDGTKDPEAAAKWAVSLLPAGSAEVKCVRELPSPFTLDGLESRELTFSYTYLAKSYTASIALVGLDKEKALAVIISARTGDFAAIHEEGTGSLFRWFWTTPSGVQQKARGNAMSTTDYLPGKK